MEGGRGRESLTSICANVPAQAAWRAAYFYLAYLVYFASSPIDHAESWLTLRVRHLFGNAMSAVDWLGSVTGLRASELSNMKEGVAPKVSGATRPAPPADNPGHATDV